MYRTGNRHMVVVPAGFLWMTGCAFVSTPTERVTVHRHSAQKSGAEWQPGDDIPGWEVYDYECPINDGGDAATVQLPDVWYAVAGFGDYEDTLVMGLTVTLADCVDAPCTTSITTDPGDAPDVFAGSTDWSVADIYSKTGFFGPDSARTESSLAVVGNVPVGGFWTDPPQSGRALSFCVSRLRPDKLVGVVSVVYTERGFLPHAYYPDMTVQYPFDVTFEDHAAWDSDIDGGDPAFEDLSWRFIGYSSPVDYDNAWDWDAITDTTIRAAVYDRYTPFNWP